MTDVNGVGIEEAKKKALALAKRIENGLHK